MYTLSQFVSKSKTINSCGDYRAPSLIVEVNEYRKLIDGLKKRDIKIRYITDITKDNLAYCRELMKLALEIRHLEGIKANFSVSESEYLASTTLLQDALSQGPIQQVIYSNVKDIVEQQKYVFESFWNRSILAEQRIKEIEEGITLGHTEVIPIPVITKELFIKLVKTSKEEVLLLLPTINAFLREERIGIIRYLSEAAHGRCINVKVLTPTNDIINDIINEKMQNTLDINLKIFVIPPFENTSDIPINTITILVVDKKESLVIEKKDDSKMDFIDAIGISTYSTSNPTVMSYVSIFENLINQIKLYEQLKIHGKMQEEFINIASHELRTPTQAIIAYSDLLQHHPEKRDEMIQAIKRNATRLQRLTEDILDVTKIESKTLMLYKEKFDLSDLLSDTIDDFRNKIEKNDCGVGKVGLLYANIYKEPFLVEADYQRVIQLVYNILNNAITFTKEGEKEGVGNVYITIEKKKKDNNSSQVSVIVAIRDTGPGIDAEILPNLFTKFATKSTKGTGLGLFICKGIIEAHGGTIWAENNKDGKGATFAFSLPFEN
ncbi:MAG: HAMP domain-containing histidine kinase [Thermoproteota archaeon]|nr:HAMP domain-containing histidine kinase [Thermoproteota archaeon]